MLSTNMVIFITLNIFTWSLYICIHGEAFGCKLSPYRGSSNHKGFLWNCSHQDIQYIPDIPAEHSRDVIAVDISHNNFKVIRESTFTNLTFDIKFLFLKKNDIASIEENAFRRVSAILLLDISSCSLGTKSIQLGAFNNLSLLETLTINGTSFQSYPAGEISKLESLVNLTIDIFQGFHFDDNFLNLKALSNLNLEPHGLLTLTNNSFQGLHNSPILYLDLNVYNQVDNFCKDLPEDLFCSFPFLKGLSISFGMSCGIKRALRTLKCLQNKQLDYFHCSDHHELNVNEVTITDFDVEYLRNVCIKELHLRNNDISQITFQLPMSKFQNCLEVVDLSSNKIQFSLSQRLWLTLVMFSPNIQVIKICCQNAPNSVTKTRGGTYSDEYKRRRETRVKRSEAFRVVFPQHLKYFDISYANDITTDLRNISIEAASLLFLNISWTAFKISTDRYHWRVGSVYLDFPLLTKMDASHTSLNVAHLSLEKLLSLTSLTVKSGSFIPPRHTLHGLKSLQYIDMSEMYTSNLPLDFFASQKDSNITIILDRSAIYLRGNTFLKALDILDHIYKLSTRDCYSEPEYYLQTYEYFHGFEMLQNLRVSKLYLRNTINCFCNEKHLLMALWNIREKIADLDDVICHNNNRSKNLEELFTDQHWRSFRLICIDDDILLVSIVLLSTTLIFLIPTMVIYKFSIISRCKALDVRGKLQTMYGRVCEFYHEMRRRSGYTYSPLNPEDIDTTRERNEEIVMTTLSTETNHQADEIRESSQLEDSDQASLEQGPAQTRAQ